MGLQPIVHQLNIKLHYIVSEFNPADYLTKPSEVGPHHPLWTQGPDILNHPERWIEFTKTIGSKDTIPVFQGALTTQPPNQDNAEEHHYEVSKHKNISQLYKETAQRRFNDSSSLRRAELFWLKIIQNKHFSEIIEFLKILNGNFQTSIKGKKLIRENKLCPPDLCRELHLFLDKDELVRVYTSAADFGSLTYDQKFPILLPKEDKIVYLIIKSAHQLVGHMGLKSTMANIRNKFWIIKNTAEIKKVIKQCNMCIIQRGKRYHYAAKASIPDFRSQMDEPFNTTALDMTGHFLCRDLKTKEESKCYILVFVCMSTGCGHVEVIDAATAEAFADALERFFARRGVPSLLLSDNGSNFKGYFPELKKISDLITTRGSLVQQGIQWKWVPSSAPTFNGYAERSLGLIKGVLKRSIGKKILSFSQLRTAAAYAEAVFNERPLHVLLDSDPLKV